MKAFSSLTNRIFLASAALTVLCISAAIYLVNVRITTAADDQLHRALEQTGAVVDQQRATVCELFVVLARTVADLPKLKAAVDTDDPPTVQPIAADYSHSVQAELFLVNDRAGRVLALIAPAGIDAQAVTDLASIREAESGREAATYLVTRNALLQAVSVPITAGPEPQIVGTLTLGFLLDDELAARFKNLTGSEIAFASGTRVIASTLSRHARPALETLLGRQGHRLPTRDDDYLVLRRPLDSPLTSALFGSNGRGLTRQAARDPASAVPTVVILRSRSERLRLLRPIQTALIVTGLFAVLLAVVLSYAISRTITRPLAAITAVMKEMSATGDLTRGIAWNPGRWEDEDARLLVRTFNTLTGSITRFQREAAERERLSALGRLSTVIAHEVRNPLMIIKASLRPLIRGGASTTEVLEAARDIDEEVARLNRVVNEVLDFARPLRFDLAPARLRELCEASTAAARDGLGGVSVRLSFDPSLDMVTTDAERLRAALVNIVVNASHAVAARAVAGVAAPGSSQAAQPGDADVQLHTERRGPDRFAIVVRDRGVGIDASELSRVFDPYFTTKRGGTGLGLAITRNIIEGLGGTIRISSERGAGTEIRMEMPITGPEGRQA